MTVFRACPFIFWNEALANLLDAFCSQMERQLLGITMGQTFSEAAVSLGTFQGQYALIFQALNVESLQFPAYDCIYFFYFCIKKLTQMQWYKQNILSQFLWIRSLGIPKLGPLLISSKASIKIVGQADFSCGA